VVEAGDKIVAPRDRLLKRLLWAWWLLLYRQTKRLRCLPLRRSAHRATSRTKAYPEHAPTSPFMYLHLRLRSQQSLSDLCDDFDHIIIRERLTPNAMALHHHHQRALTTPDLHNYHSTASAPSMRSKEPMEMARPFTPPDADGGNVKVVVRVRKFIRRGRL